MITKVYEDYYEKYKEDYKQDWIYAKDKLLNKLYGFDDRGEFTIEIIDDLQEKEQEIERLNNDIKILLQENGNKEKVIKAQDNIIKEVREYVSRIIIDETYTKCILEILDKVGVDKECK